MTFTTAAENKWGHVGNIVERRWEEYKSYRRLRRAENANIWGRNSDCNLKIITAADARTGSLPEWMCQQSGRNRKGLGTLFLTAELI